MNASSRAAQAFDEKSVAQNTFNIDNGELLSWTAIILENHCDYKGFLWPKIDWHMLLCAVGWFKNAFSSETDKIMLGTTFSHYLGIKQCRKPKIENFYTFFHPVQAL